MREDVLDGRGFLLIRGLRVERWDMRASAAAFFGIGLHLGRPRSQNGKGHVLGMCAISGSIPAIRTCASIKPARARASHRFLRRGRPLVGPLRNRMSSPFEGRFAAT